MRPQKCSPAFTVISIGLVSLFLLPALALSEETYVFQRMWPTLQQSWYFSVPKGIAIDHDNFLYIADTNTHSVKKMTRDGQLVTTWGTHGDQNGQFRYPYGIAIDRDGNVYVSESEGGDGQENHRIQKFTSNGQFIAKWGGHGSSDGKFDCPSYMAFDSKGYLYVADRENSRVQKFTADGTFVRKWWVNLSKPVGIAVDNSDQIYVSDESTGLINVFSSEGQLIKSWYTYGWSPRGLWIDGEGYIYVIISDSHVIKKFDQSGNLLQTIGEYGEGDGNFHHPYSMAIDQEGYKYVVDSGCSRIQKFYPNWQFLIRWGTGNGKGEFLWPDGVAVDNNAQCLYVADSSNFRIQKFGLDGTYISQWSCDGFCDGLALDNNGFLYVAERHGAIKKYQSDGTLLKTWTDGFSEPYGVAVSADGSVFVADTMNCRIMKCTSAGDCQPWATGYDQLGDPRGIAIDANNNVYVSDYISNKIIKFDADGNYKLHWGSTGTNNGQFRFPWGISVNADGQIYVCDQGNDRIQVFDSLGNFITSFGGTGSLPGQFNDPYRVAFGADGRIFVSDSGNNRIQAFAPNSAPQEKQDKAILVAGGGPFAGNNIWDATQWLANHAYRVLTYQGYTKDTIYYLTSDTGLDLDGNGIPDDVDADATNSNLQTAITSWAQDANNLLIYMVDHGGSGMFRMRAGEVLSATELDAWLDGIQGTIPGTVTLIYDACRSGSFLASLAPPSGKERILATSASADQESLFTSQGTISFSFFFWGHVFNGDSFYDSFFHAMNSIGATYHQSPQLDGNGNGIGNEQGDLEVARGIKVGNEMKFAGDIPYISSVSPAQTLSGETSAAIYADGVTDADGISRVWAVITPPGYSSASPDIPMTDLPILELPSTGGSRYQATYNGFTTSGTYNIAVYAMDGRAVISLPKTTTVSQGAGVSLLYYPHVDTTSGWETEIAAINTGAQQAACTLNGYSSDGGLVESKSITLNPKGRSEMTVSRAFANHSSIKYFILSSDTGTIKGYTKFYQIGQHRVAIPAVSEINTSDIYVSHIASDADWWTGIGLLNTTASAKSVTMEFNTGETKDIELSANQHTAFMIETLFGQSRPDIQSARITHAEGVIGLELFGSTGGVSRLEGIPLTDDTTTTLYYPHVASDAEWWTGVVAYNPSETGGSITITPYSAEGTVLASSTLPIAGKEKYVGLASALGLPSETAWFRIDSTLPLSGFELFCTLPDESRLGAYARMGSAGGTEGVFAKIEKDGWTGIAFVNTGEGIATVTLTAYDDSGVKRAVSSILLNPHAKVVNMVENLFLQDITGATYITYSSDQNVVGFQLNGSADSTMLDGLPGL